MEFHGVDIQGELFIQSTPSLPAWAASDERRVLYTQDSSSFYYGTNAQWMPLGFPPGTKVWFYQNTAPTGWSIAAGCGDRLLAVKGGVQAYSVVGGNQAGTWSISGLTKDAHTHSAGSYRGPNHTHANIAHHHSTADHTLTDNEMPTHNHTSTGSALSAGAHTHSATLGLSVSSFPDTRAVAAHYSNGGTLAITSAGAHTHTISITVGNKGGGQPHNHGVTGLGSSNILAGGTGLVTGSSGAQSNNGISSNAAWRTSANVGIIAEKD